MTNIPSATFYSPSMSVALTSHEGAVGSYGSSSWIMRYFMPISAATIALTPLAVIGPAGPAAILSTLVMAPSALVASDTNSSPSAVEHDDFTRDLDLLAAMHISARPVWDEVDYTEYPTLDY